MHCKAMHGIAMLRIALHTIEWIALDYTHFKANTSNCLQLCAISVIHCKTLI